ncbi:molybdopterin molybdenumtransferase MoeA [Actibacterium sp. 188UL27-1]|nr:molybdopterin-binding protein [Actibacterium sp. 188UL27-1]MBM7068533.1 molybdopterin molybdenumtransferase MoeA [Actibacterium sp. 188UL27-1]
MVDWSARSKPSAQRPEADAIWIAVDDDVTYHRTRAAAEAALIDLLDQAAADGDCILVGFDFAFGYPAGFAKGLIGRDDAKGVWAWLADAITDSPDNANNRFETADRINASFPGTGPFWGRVKTRGDLPALPWGKDGRGGFGLAEHRMTEEQAKGAKTVWQLMGNGAVGSQVLLGLPLLHRLSQRFGACLAVWPFEQADNQQIVVAEIYPSLINTMVTEAGGIKDAAQVRLLAAAFAEMQTRGTLGEAFAAAPDRPQTHQEGWILGAGVTHALRSAAQAAAHPDLHPPTLSDNCFALPPGVAWIPVDTALTRLRTALTPVVGTENIPLDQATTRIAACTHLAQRANPPAPNTAVDGYGFAYQSASDAGRHVLPLVAGQAAAGQPWPGTVPDGHAIRILTGAVLPSGVDTVILQEDVTCTDTHIVFEGPVKAGANTRKAGEDFFDQTPLLTAGQRLRPPDIALLAAAGCAQVEVFQSLRVGILSTGDEIVQPGHATRPEHTHDANRPMLLGLIRSFGHQAVDLGHVADDRDVLRDMFDRAMADVDAIMTSGGASAGDEDHVSALLQAEGHLTAWRIALKPGRPLALAQWQGKPVFGLPGNPVAALVCTLIFARPALSTLSGGPWLTPQAFHVPAAFDKRKKPGRREYLRARLNTDGEAEIFTSEGSGRISGLSWADGLVELSDGELHITPGMPVRYLPYTGFGL